MVGEKKTKIFKHTQTTCHLRPANCLSVFDHFVGLALKGLKITLVNKENLMAELGSLTLVCNLYRDHVLIKVLVDSK